MCIRDSLSQSIQPVVIYYHDASIGGIYTVTASYKHENKAKVIDFLRRLDVYKRQNPATPTEINKLLIFQ